MSSLRSLLDASFLIALFDSNHAFNKRAQAWWNTEHSRGWASCPLTENAVFRVMSNPNYDPDNRTTLDDSIDQFREFVLRSDHKFFGDTLSFRDGAIFDTQHILGFRQLTDVYLLALATLNNGRLVTFDKRISLAAVRHATPENLVII